MSFGFSPTPGGVQEYGFRFDPRLSQQVVRLEYAGLTGETTFPAYNKDGWVWLVNRLVGWWESAPDSTKTVDAPWGDGSLAFARRFGARPISLSGFVVVQDGRADGVLEEALDRLAASHSGTLVVDELRRGVSREADVRLTDMRVSRLGGSAASVTLSLQADDPLRYGTSVLDLTNGRNVLVNPGDAVAFPIIDLRGPHSTVTVTHDGGEYSFPALSSGQRRTIDCRHGDVWAGDARVFVGSGPWPRVGVGGAEWQVAGLGSGSATVRRFQAWT